MWCTRSLHSTSLHHDASLYITTPHPDMHGLIHHVHTLLLHDTSHHSPSRDGTSCTCSVTSCAPNDGVHYYSLHITMYITTTSCACSVTSCAYTTTTWYTTPYTIKRWYMWYIMWCISCSSNGGVHISTHHIISSSDHLIMWSHVDIMTWCKHLNHLRNEVLHALSLLGLNIMI